MKSRFAGLVDRPAPIRIAVFLGILLGAWLPLAIPIYLLGQDDNQVTIASMGLLFVGFLVWLGLWGRWVYGNRAGFRRYGLSLSRQNGGEYLLGLGIGVVSLAVLFGLEGALGWLRWQEPSLPWPRLVMEGLLSASAIAMAEELVFRGWLLEELSWDYRPSTALWANSVAFGVLHFLKPLNEILRTWPAFPGLVLLGLTLVWARRSRQGRLGLSIGLHAGLVWGYYVTDVGKLITYTQQVPVWVTGIDRNPLAGLMGLMFLGAIAVMIQRQSNAGALTD